MKSGHLLYVVSMRLNRTKRTIAVFAAGCFGAGVAGAMTGPMANAAPAPCTAAGLSAVVSRVTAEASQYLDAHPDANDALTQAGSQPPEEAKGAIRSYFFSHVDEYFQLQTIAKPLSDLRAQCNTTLSVSQIGAVLDALND
jgi:hemophore-related protein